MMEKNVVFVIVPPSPVWPGGQHQALPSLVQFGCAYILDALSVFFEYLSFTFQSL